MTRPLAAQSKNDTVYYCQQILLLKQTPLSPHLNIVQYLFIFVKKLESQVFLCFSVECY